VRRIAVELRPEALDDLGLISASGYVLKSVADRDLVEACRAAMRGEAFLYPSAETSLIRDFLRQAAVRGRPGGPLALPSRSPHCPIRARGSTLLHSATRRP
jgi:DNA-binding NarL/FixJ family response regulator